MSEIKGGHWVLVEGIEHVEGSGDPNDPCVVAGIRPSPSELGDSGNDIIELYRPSDDVKLWVRRWGLRRIETPEAYRPTDPWLETPEAYQPPDS